MKQGESGSIEYDQIDVPSPIPIEVLHRPKPEGIVKSELAHYQEQLLT